MPRFVKLFGVIALCLGLCAGAYAEPTTKLAKRHSAETIHASTRKARAKTSPKAKKHVAATTRTAKSSHANTKTRSVATTKVSGHKHRRGSRTVLAVRRTRHHAERFTASSYADNLTLGDVTAADWDSSAAIANA